jgi:hypothetical protein
MEGEMSSKHGSFSAGRRKLLAGLGAGAAGTALLAVTGSSRLFAAQFVGEATRIDMPKMIYDPELQMMVDPVTRVPVYEDMSTITVASGLPIVTANCSDCPKNDGTSE